MAALEQTLGVQITDLTTFLMLPFPMFHSFGVPSIPTTVPNNCGRTVENLRNPAVFPFLVGSWRDDHVNDLVNASGQAEPMMRLLQGGAECLQAGNFQLRISRLE